MTVSFITTEQTYSLRNEVLRPGKPVESVFLEKDNHPETFHLGTIVDERIISVGSFHPSVHEQFAEARQYQLRKMATDPAFRKTGAGRILVEKGLNELRNRQVQLLWCNAREVAIGFYEKLGFTTKGDFFDVPGIGPHKLMYIKLFE